MRHLLFVTYSLLIWLSAFTASATNRYQSLETLAKGLFYLETMYVDPEKVDQDRMAQNALKGVINQLDPHTVLMPKQAFEQMTIDTQGKFGGVGIIVSQEKGKLIVVSPIEDTPADKAGIKSGDEIIAINGIKIHDLKNADAVEEMRGEIGSTVKLTVKRPKVKEHLEFEMVREVIKVKSVRSHALAGDIDYIRISSFQETTSDEVERILRKKKGQLTGLILDLRDNPGGLLDQAVKVSDLFIDSGIIVSTIGRDPKRIEREFARKRGTYADFPVVILINGGAASASEIVAGALQDHERAVIMGTTSFGKGSVQTLVSLPDGSGLKLTVARYYTPKGRSIQAKGIQPDIVVTSTKTVTAPSDKSNSATIKKEADLERHIESKDLNDLAAQSVVTSQIKNWPEMMQKDHQLVTAFSYLKSWARFDHSHEKPATSKAAIKGSANTPQSQTYERPPLD